jgi:hypothetical protein
VKAVAWEARQFRRSHRRGGSLASAKLDEGAMWPTAIALTELTADDEARIGALATKR